MNYDLLKLNLQHFAEQDEGETNIDETLETPNSTDASENTEEGAADKVDNKIPYSRFKEKVDEANALKERLAEIEQAQAESKRKELEEQENYKALYEQALDDAQKANQLVVETKKQTALTQAGYDADKVSYLTKLVEGDTDEEISESIKELKRTFPTEEYYGDPSLNNGVTSKPKTVDADDIATEQFARIKGKIFRK